MNVLDLFAGAGGSILAGKLLGWRCVCAVELDAYCRRVLLQRQRDGILPLFPIWDDIRTFDGRGWRGRVDVVTAGFPCQPFSVAGKRKGAADGRNLWPETMRILNEVRPRFCLLENVPALITSGYFGIILGDLAEGGFDARWCVLSAAGCGAPHIRKRLWIVAHADEPGLEVGKGERGNNGKEQPSSVRTDWWEAEPPVGRVVDGMANRVAMLRALGNGWVPLVAAKAWETMTDAAD